jgi:hypothetical protein
MLTRPASLRLMFRFGACKADCGCREACCRLAWRVAGSDFVTMTESFQTIDRIEQRSPRF